MKKSFPGFLLMVASLVPLLDGCFFHRAPPHGMTSKPAEPPTVEPIVVAQAPPAAQREVVTASPGPGFVWIPGYWSWQGRWLWIPGTWVPGPHPRAVWVAGHWAHHMHGYVWIGGHWK